MTKEDLLEKGKQVNALKAADLLAALLMDKNVSTNGVFEEILYLYENAEHYTPEALIEKMFSLLTGETLGDFIDSISKEVQA